MHSQLDAEAWSAFSVGSHLSCPNHTKLPTACPALTELSPEGARCVEMSVARATYATAEGHELEAALSPHA